MKKLIRVFCILAVVFFVTFFSSGCGEEKNLKTTLEKNEVTIILGEEIKVGVIGKDGEEIIWNTEDSSIASVDNGTIIGVSEGTTYIIVKCGELKARIKVIVVKNNNEGYTITWLNYNEEVLEVDENVLEGTMPTFDGKIPARDGYEFKGWDPEVVLVTGNATYTAQYTVFNTFEIIWKNWDGVILATGIVPEGTMPVYNGPAPTKESDDYYDYMFIGWSPKVEQAQYKRTYTAQFAGVKKLFTVTWKDPWGGVLKIDENVEAGTYADYTGPIPTMPNNPHTGARNKFYNWWPNPNSIKILTDTTFTAQFREIYKITWRNEGVILKDEDVFKGVLPVYTDPEPTRPRDSKYLYTFKDWAPTIETVKDSDMEYEATYDCFPNPSLEFEFEESVTYGGYMITNYKLKETGEVVVIPEWYNGMKVTEIFYEAFKDSLKLKTVIFSSNLIWVYQGAFENCQSLENIDFGSKITHIEQSTFKNCTSLKMVDLTTAPIEEIRMEAFKGCVNLEEVYFNEGLKEIGWGAFEDCEKLLMINFPKSLENIETVAFSNCTSLGLVKFVEDGNLLHIGSFAFYNCTSLNKIEIPASVKTIWNGAFKECRDLTYITFNEGLEQIGSYVFHNCVSLKDFILPTTLLEIGDEAFGNCQGIITFRIPKNVNNIGEILFAGSKNVTALSVDEDNETYDSRNNCNAIIKTDTNSLIVACKTTIIPNTVVTIENGAFYKIDIESVTIPASVKHIKSGAFHFCHALPHHNFTRTDNENNRPHEEMCKVTIFIPSTVETIGANAFIFDDQFNKGGEIIGAIFCLHTNVRTDNMPEGWTFYTVGYDQFRFYIGCYVHWGDGGFSW